MTKLPPQPVHPTHPWKPEYEEHVEKRYIYAFKESLQEDEWDDEDDEEEDDEDYDEVDKSVPQGPISEVNLGWLISLAPEGVSPADIKIEFGYNANSHAYEDHYVRFYYEVTVPARPAEYKAAMKRYEAEKTQYELDLLAYAEAKRLQEIEEAEAKLAKLKGTK